MRKLVQTSPSPKSSRAALPPSFDSISPPAPFSKLSNESNSTATGLTPNDINYPDQLIDPPLPNIFPPPLAPTLQSSPPPQPANSPPATTGSPPTPNGPPSASSPPSVPGSPPPLPPPSIPSSPPASSPPPPTDAMLSPLPPSPPSLPPKDATSPPPAHSPPPSPPAVPLPKSSPPPSPSKRPTSPPPSRASPPKVSQSPPSPPPPHNSHSAPPPTVTPPPPGPLTHWPLPSSPPPPSTNTSVVGIPPTSHRPLNPKEKPTDWPTNDTGVPESTSSSATEGMAISGVVVFVVLGLIAMAVFFVRKRKRRGSKPTLTLGYPAASPFGSPHNSGSYLLRPPASLKGTNYSSNFIYSSSEQGGLNNSRFTYEELAHATDSFSADNELGEGGFGKVYKGVLADGREVAVKQLKAGGGQGEREFRAEVDIISRIHHRHLVSLVGYCVSERQRLLVYDYVPNNTLHYHLHGVGRPVLEWSIRVKVAAGAARGLAYLHEDCNPRIIHRDIKSANILLDNNYEAKVADFGLAKLAMELESHTHVSTRVMGTFGYMAPEYATTGKLTEKSDVYSFGVVLLELITGHRPVDDSGHLGDESLVEWARPRLLQALETEVFDQLVDPRLARNYSASEMFRIVEAAAACVRHQAARRPKMSQVVRALDSIGEESGLSNGMRFGQSEVINSAEHSAQIKKFQRMAFGNESSQDYTSSYISHSQSSWRS